MNILKLTLCRKWFDMILRGEKPYEYRGIKVFWTRRLMRSNDVDSVFCPDYWEKATIAILNNTVKEEHFDIEFREFDAIEFYRGVPYFDPESQRRTEPVDRIRITPAMEVLFDSPEVLAGAIEKLSSSLRGKRADAAKAALTRDSDRVKNGLELGNIDKYLPLAYDAPALIFDYLSEDSPVVFCEYRNCLEKAKN